MSESQCIAGPVGFLIDGTAYEAGDGEFTGRILGEKKEPIPGTPYYKIAVEWTWVKGSVVLKRGFDPMIVAKASDGITMQVNGRNGNTYVWKNSYNSSGNEISITDGKMDVEFSAGPYDCDVITR